MLRFDGRDQSILLGVEQHICRHFSIAVTALSVIVHISSHVDVVVKGLPLKV